MYKDGQIDRQMDMDRSLTDNVIKVNLTRPLENQNVTGVCTVPAGIV